MVLGEEYFELFATACNSLELPFQSPVTVVQEKKAMVEDKETGRIINYTSIHSNTLHSSIVLILPQTDLKVGVVQKFFIYRSKTFALIKICYCALHDVNGLIHVVQTTSSTPDEVILPLQQVSRPLVTNATFENNLSDFWIVNL